MDFLALMIASLTMPALLCAGTGAVLGYLIWGWFGSILGLILGYGAGVFVASRYAGVPLSPHVRGWLSLIAFLGGLTLLAILTR